MAKFKYLEANFYFCGLNFENIKTIIYIKKETSKFLVGGGGGGVSTLIHGSAPWSLVLKCYKGNDGLDTAFSLKPF